MSRMKLINVAKEFDPEPAGRYPADGPANGERFRAEYLVPAFAKNDEVVVDFDGTEGYGSSFLEEAFGGLVREGMSPSELRKRLKITSTEDDTVIEEVWQYIDEAQVKLTAR